MGVDPAQDSVWSWWNGKPATPKKEDVMIRSGIRTRLWVFMVALIFSAALILPFASSGSTHAGAPYPECDVDGAGGESITDALLIAQRVVGLIGDGDVANPQFFDCNGDGSVSITDGLFVAQRVVGLI